MISISIIGSGNVAQHLIKAISNASNLELVQVFARNQNAIHHLINQDKVISDFSKLLHADLYLIAVSDDAIQSVSESFLFENKLVAHTSGSQSIEVLSNKNRKAVFYPLQTFSKSKEVNFKEIPICLEAQNLSDMKLLTQVAKDISDVVIEINSNQRKSLHVAAVFVSNFANHLYKIGSDICTENDVPFDILKPLITETANKINTLAPIDAQTGPAKRKDSQTINSHLDFLTNENQKDIYKILTKSIIDDAKKL